MTRLLKKYIYIYVNEDLNQVIWRKSFKFCINNLYKSKVPLFSFKSIEDSSKIPLRWSLSILSHLSPLSSKPAHSLFSPFFSHFSISRNICKGYIYLLLGCFFFYFINIKILSSVIYIQLVKNFSLNLKFKIWCYHHHRRSLSW